MRTNLTAWYSTIERNDMVVFRRSKKNLEKLQPIYYEFCAKNR